MRSRAVTVAGCGTLLWGVYSAVLGPVAVLNGVGWLNRSGDPWWPVITLFGVLPVVVILIGVGFILFGGVGVVAGVGVVRRKGWARVLTVVLAALVLLAGAAGLTDASGATTVDIITAVARVGYGVCAPAVLARHP